MRRVTQCRRPLPALFRDDGHPTPIPESMSGAPKRAAASAEPLMDRLQPWIAGLASALLHLLFFLILIWSAKVVLAPPQGASSGGRTRVQFVGEPQQADPGPVTPPSGSKATGKRPKPRKQTKPRPVDAMQSPPLKDAKRPVPQESTTPEDAAAGQQSQTTATSPPSHRRSATWGRPPGTIVEESPSPHAGMAPGISRNQGGRDAAANGPSMEADGFQILYDVLSEERLRAWRDQGMTEVSFPLPGKRDYMVCPLEIVARRGSGPCRLVNPDAPEMQKIGDARKVVIVMRVYRRGELVWRGPGPYR